MNMKYRRNGKLLDTDAARLIAEKGKTQIYKNRNFDFFVIDESIDGKKHVYLVEYETAEDWVKKNCPKQYKNFFMEDLADYRVQFTLPKEYLPVLNSLCCESGMNKSAWLLNETTKLLKKEMKKRGF